MGRVTVGWTVGWGSDRACGPATRRHPWSDNRARAWLFGSRADAEAWRQARARHIDGGGYIGARLVAKYQIRRVTRAASPAPPIFVAVTTERGDGVTFETAAAATAWAKRYAVAAGCAAPRVVRYEAAEVVG